MLNKLLQILLDKVRPKSQSQEPLPTTWQDQKPVAPVPQPKPSALTQMPGPVAIRLIKLSEGLRLQAYQDPLGIWTIGYGNTSMAKPGKYITQDLADTFLETDALIAAQDVHRLVKVDLTQGQLDALTDFVYNFGAKKFADSTLLKRVNSKDWLGAAEEFGKWVHGTDSKGVKIKLPGLVTRRAREVQVFTTGDFT